jgi:hypothetical protein
MKKVFVLTMIVGLMVLGPYATAGHAFLIIPSGSYNFQAMVTPNQDNSPYWDGNSSDYNNPDTPGNIGNWILKSDAYSSSSTSPAITLGNAQYYGSAGGNFDSSFYFKDGSATATLKLEDAGYAGANSSGFYPVDQHGNLIAYSIVEDFTSGYSLVATPQYYQVFAGGDTPGGSPKTATVSPYFGLYIKANDKDYYHTQSGLNPNGDKNFQHFTVFRDKTNSPNLYYIGIEDLRVSGDRDYQDHVFSLKGGQGGVVPLPGAVLLLGAGMARMVAYARRRRD